MPLLAISSGPSSPSVGSVFTQKHFSKLLTIFACHSPKVTSFSLPVIQLLCMVSKCTSIVFLNCPQGNLIRTKSLISWVSLTTKQRIVQSKIHHFYYGAWELTCPEIYSFKGKSHIYAHENKLFKNSFYSILPSTTALTPSYGYLPALFKPDNHRIADADKPISSTADPSLQTRTLKTMVTHTI